MAKNRCKGFKAAGIASGLKKNGEKDLGLIYSEVSAKVAGVFTRNKVKAAPLLLNIDRIKSGIGQAIIVNSGNANCCTGDQGIQDAKAMAGFAASELKISEDLVLVASTGVIGEPLPIEKIRDAVPKLTGLLKPEGINDFVMAIMTTDTMPKIITRQEDLGGKIFSVTGVAKGSGMISPDMATMLCFVYTDVDLASDFLKDSLNTATERSLNRITIDGDTSTNDMVLVMANGLSGAVIESSADKETFQSVLDDVLIGLAKQLVKDGEGATKFVEINVRGALSDTDARTIADTIANSPLVKTAIFGEDANWGRVMMALGRAGVSVDPDKVDIFFDDFLVVKNGMKCGEDTETEITKVLKKPEFEISIDLNMGHGDASVFTCDFSVDYVKINADYRT